MGGRVSILTVVGEIEARPVTAAHVERPVGAERERSDQRTRVLRHQSSISTCSAPVITLLTPEGARGARRHHAAIPGRAGASGRIRENAGRTPARRGLGTPVHGRRVENIDVGGGWGSWMKLQDQATPVPEVVDVDVEIGEESCVVSVRPSKTLMRPLFSATKTRPSVENLTAVG